MKEYSIGGIPIIDNDGKLLGIVTNRDLRFQKDCGRPFKEVTTSDDLVPVNQGTALQEAEKVLEEHKIEKLPVVTEDNKLLRLITYRDIAKLTQKPNANKDSYGRLRVAAALGVTGDVMERAQALVDAHVDAVIIDTAHGHSEGVIKVLKQIKRSDEHTSELQSR